MAVASRDENVDALGACVGQRGMRVQAVMNELGNEKIDIIEWDPILENYISNALSPAKVVNVDIYEEDNMAIVVVPDHQLSLAIGSEGQNARLAARLTGWRIDIKSESQYHEMRENEFVSRVEAALDDLSDRFPELGAEEEEEPSPEAPEVSYASAEDFAASFEAVANSLQPAAPAEDEAEGVTAPDEESEG
jgi:N utilization substance protein A